MPAPVPLSTLRTQVRYWADAQTQATSGFFLDAELDARINAAVKQLYNNLVRARGHGYYSKSTAWLPLLANQATYVLPSDFFELECLTAGDGSSYMDLDTWQEGERGAMLSSGAGGASDLGSMRYRLKADRFELCPAPGGAGWSYQLRYVPTCPTLVLATDTFDGINGWEQWVVLTVAIGMLSKEECDPSVLMAERAPLDAQISAMAAERDALRPDRILDTLGDWAST